MAERRRGRPASPRAAVAAATLSAAISAGSLFVGCAGPSVVAERPRPAATPESGPAATTPAPAPSAPGGPPPVSAAWRSVREIDVGLAAGVTRCLLAGSRPWRLATGTGKILATGGSGDRIEISRLDQGTVEVFREKEAAPLWTGAPAETLHLLSEGGGLVGWSGRWYRGAFRVFGSAGAGLTLVNEVDLEGYLRGVLPSEIGTPPPDQYEAVKAQAVAARSYTLSYLGRRAEQGFDLWATVEDQVYEGTKRENGQSDRALRETRGEVLLAEGVPIRALYSSTCGGRTSNVEDVWPWPWTSYLRSVRDADDGGEPYCARSSSFRWTENWSVADFLETIRTYAPAEGASPASLRGDLLEVRVGARSRCGRVAELRIETTAGETVLHGDRIRWSLRRPGPAAAILRSSFFKIGVARDASGKPTRVVVSGAGNGHGIGLCQYGAMGMAQSGKDYRRILAHYYEGALLERI